MRKRRPSDESRIPISDKLTISKPIFLCLPLANIMLTVTSRRVRLSSKQKGVKRDKCVNEHHQHHCWGDEAPTPAPVH